MAARELLLQHNRPVRIAGTTRIECVEGKVWLTQAGMAGDKFLLPGDRHALDWPEMALVEALGGARIVLHAPVSRLRHLRRAARFLLSSLHECMRALRRPGRGNPLAG